MTTEEMHTALYEKFSAEQDNYRAWLLKQTPEERRGHHTGLCETKEKGNHQLWKNLNRTGGTPLATTRLMPLHVGKGRSVGTAISDIIDYVENPDKTDKGQLVTSYGCNARIGKEHHERVVHSGLQPQDQGCASR